jgi:hypothetical protein
MIGVNLLKDRKMMTLEEAKRQAKEKEMMYNPQANAMTLRDYFAAKAMQELLQHTAESTHQLASESYDIADAMLKAREME